MNAVLKRKFLVFNAYIRKEICSAKDCTKRTKRQATDWEKIFAKDTSDNELLSKIYKKLLKFNSKKTNLQLKNRSKTLIATTKKKIN